MIKTNHIVLLGAGFSRNWGGWLASEAFDYLLGSRELDDTTRNLLWKYKNSGGFESALSEIQEQPGQDETSSNRLVVFQSAIQKMFSDMNKAYEKTSFEFLPPMQDYKYGIGYFLSGFDAIFTLNQDLLLEQHYLSKNDLSLKRNGNFISTAIPGIKEVRNTFDPFVSAYCGKCIPDLSNRLFDDQTQPYFKLHGSCNWETPENNHLLIVGGNKNLLIDQHPHLKWSLEQFVSYLDRADTCLMVIGYSFCDEHINEIILQAARNRDFSLFIIDPNGVDVLRSDELIFALGPRIIGSSRRHLSEIFGRDIAEHGKVMRFFG